MTTPTTPRGGGAADPAAAAAPAPARGLVASLWQFVRFCVVGGSGVIVNLAVFTAVLLVWLAVSGPHRLDRRPHERRARPDRQEEHAGRARGGDLRRQRRRLRRVGDDQLLPEPPLDVPLDQRRRRRAAEVLHGQPGGLRRAARRSSGRCASRPTWRPSPASSSPSSSSCRSTSWPTSSGASDEPPPPAMTSKTRRTKRSLSADQRANGPPRATREPPATAGRTPPPGPRRTRGPTPPRQGHRLRRVAHRARAHRHRAGCSA